MEIKVSIDEGRITELVEDAIVKKILTERGYENREAGIGLRNAVDKAVKNYIYKNKEAIIERVVERATKEIVRKGLPKFLANLSDEQ